MLTGRGSRTTFPCGGERRPRGPAWRWPADPHELQGRWDARGRLALAAPLSFDGMESPPAAADGPACRRIRRNVHSSELNCRPVPGLMSRRLTLCRNDSLKQQLEQLLL